MRFIFCCLLILWAATSGFAQSGRRSSRDTSNPSSVEPRNQDEYKLFRDNQHKKKKRAKEKLTFTEQKIAEYEDRMEANAKKYREMNKEMEKPRYSDPSYFGHKNKPKKRPPGKKKFCKECGIVH